MPKSLQPVSMYKIRIVGQKKSQQKAIEALHAEKVLHIEDFKPGKYNVGAFSFDIGDPLKEASNYSQLLVRIRSLVANLKIKRDDFNIEEKIPKTPELVLKKAEEGAEKIIEKIKNADERKKDLEKQDEPLKLLIALKMNPKDLKPLETIAVFKGYYEGDFIEKLEKITKKYEFIKGRFEKRQVFVLFVGREVEGKVKELLNEHSYQEVHLPEKIEFNSFDQLKMEREVLEKKEDALSEQLEKLKENKGAFLVSYEAFLSRENEKAEAPLRFGQTQNVFIAEGFVPVKRFESIKEKLERQFGKKIHIEKSEEAVDFAPPTELEHGKAVESFEFFLDLYSMPFYKELDPTVFIFLAFPLFFGFMLGDVGYGIVTTLLFLVVRFKTKSKVLKGLMNIMLLASIASIAFGFVFGEFFGGAYFGLKQFINREHDINFLILMTLLVGIIHVNLGLVLGFFNVKREHGFTHAALEKLSWIVLEAGGFLILFKMYNYFYTSLPQQMYIGLGVVLVGLLMLLKGHGIYGIIEVPSLASNILSYARLFALGLASVALALIINEFAAAFFAKGGVMIVPAILILIAGHAMNIALGIIGGFLQSLRLHYVEFFTKFYKGGGKRYNPFGG